MSIFHRITRFIKRTAFFLIFLTFSTITLHLLIENNHEIKSFINENRMMKMLNVNHKPQAVPIGNPKVSLFVKSIKLENILRSQHQPRDGKNIFFIDSSHVLANVSDVMGIREACSYESAGIGFFMSKYCLIFPIYLQPSQIPI